MWLRVIALLVFLAMLNSAMTIEERRARDRAARRRLIVATARQLAEAEGWDAVTTRRLSTEIEYSQPVLYKHFSGMDAIAEAVAIDGFAELSDALRIAGSGTGKPDEKFRRIAHAYIDFARDNPALYDAMFTRATTLNRSGRLRPEHEFERIELLADQFIRTVR